MKTPAKVGRVEVRIARTLDDLMQVMAVRAAVYFEEQHCPYAEEFDGNDFAGATHLIARIDGEPGGVMRMRWFAGFAKVERVAVRKRLRGGALARGLIKACIKLAEQKGYRTILGHVEPALLPFWKHYGGVVERPGRPEVAFSDRRYAEVIKVLNPPEDAISLDTDAIVLLRPEGEWDRAGVLDASAVRMNTSQGRSA